MSGMDEWQAAEIKRLRANLVNAKDWNRRYAEEIIDLGRVIENLKADLAHAKNALIEAEHYFVSLSNDDTLAEDGRDVVRAALSALIPRLGRP